MARGHRNKEIAASLRISDETVHVHLKNIFVKLDVSDRTAAVFVANQRGILHLEHPYIGPPPRPRTGDT